VNIKEYISSGIIESYCIGNCSEKECAEVEKFAAEYPEIKAEIEAVQNALDSYALKHAIAPPESLKDKVISTIETLEEIHHREQDAKVKSINSLKPVTFDYRILLVAASLVLLIASAFFIFRMSGELKSMQSQLVALTWKNDSLLTSTIAQKEQQQKAEQQLALLKDPMNKMVELKGLKAAPDSKAMVMWNTASKEVYIEIEKLPAPPENMQYQLWALHDGKPVDAGMIEMTSDSIEMHKMKNIEQAQAFAITLEKKGGNPSPQGEMYVMGNI
jgi:anti-sigma-K factor RskA